MDIVEQFEQLLNKLYNLPPKPTEYCYYVIEEMVPYAEKWIEEGYFPHNTEIIVMPKTLQEDHIKQVSSEALNEVLKIIPYEEEE